MCLTAGAIALSSVHLAVRIIVLLLLVPMMITGAISNAVMRAMGAPSSFGSVMGLGWMAALFVGVYTYLMLEIAAGRIAPVSENHAAPKRLLALALGLGAVIIAILSDAEKTAVWFSASFLACGWVVLEALCERTVPVPSLYHSLARRGVLGRLAGRLLYPGWATGLLFTALLMAMVGASLWISISKHSTGSLDDLWKFFLMFPIGCSAVLAPVLVLLIFPRVRQPMWLYLLIQALCALLFLIARIIGGNSPRMEPTDAYRWLAPFPTSVFFALIDDNYGLLHQFFAMVCLPICALILGFLAIRALREFRVISQYERECVQETPTA
jgi:hypothetical protein